MAKLTVRYRDNKFTPKVEKLQRNVVGATRKTLYEAANVGQEHIVDVMMASTTDKGHADVARGYGYTRDGRKIMRNEPGRFLTGDMVNSVISQQLTRPPMATQNARGHVVQKIGVAKPVFYMKWQEALHGMKAIHKGGLVFMNQVLTHMNLELHKAGKAAEANKVYERIQRNWSYDG